MNGLLTLHRLNWNSLRATRAHTPRATNLVPGDVRSSKNAGVFEVMRAIRYAPAPAGTFYPPHLTSAAPAKRGASRRRLGKDDVLTSPPDAGPHRRSRRRRLMSIKKR